MQHPSRTEEHLPLAAGSVQASRHEVSGFDSVLPELLEMLSFLHRRTSKMATGSLGQSRFCVLDLSTHLLDAQGRVALLKLGRSPSSCMIARFCVLI